MPRKLIRKYMPNEEKLRNHKYLGWFGQHLHEPNLWHLTRKSVSRAFFVGLFCALLPIPFQMLLAAVMAFFFRSNLPISIGLVWLTNPLTMPPIFYFTYRVGAFLLGEPAVSIAMDFSVEAISHELGLIWKPLLLGSVVSGLLLGLAGYVAIRLFWVWHVTRSWKRRALRNRKAKTPLN